MPPPLIGFKASQWDVEWPALLETWELADSLPEFDSAWLFDHFSAVRNRAVSTEGAHEAWTVAAALAARTHRLRFGHLVIGNTHRHPALVARMATTVDHVAGPGRFVLGLGTGWLEADHVQFGWPLPSPAERTSMLDSAVRVIKAMWAEPQGATLVAGPYELREALTQPPPLSTSGPPIWLGTMGIRRGLRIVAEHADGWNANGTVAEFLERRDALLRHCEAVDRDPEEIEISAQLICIDRSPSEVLAAADQLIASGARHLIFVILASDGPEGLRRLARDVVAPLRDRHG
jgi:alkanesulfonate monooxygenase SsuD/methylene tetrahydromethanopterin reductase-like flavin-dependent oxidoreductase (luciferase family)